MTTKFGKPVPYNETATRPAWQSLPDDVRADIVAHLGGEPAEVRIAGSGFTSGFAALLTTGDGQSMFVKAAGPHLPFVVDAYTREAYVNAALPAEIPAPRVGFASQVGEWVVLGFDPIDGKAPRLPMSPDEVTVMLDAWARTAEILQSPPQSMRDLELPTFVDHIGDLVRQFTAAAAGESTMDLLPPQLLPRMDELVRLEQLLPQAIASPGVTHGDLRPDNMILTADAAWICDWNWPSHAAAFLDTACFLIVVSLGGHDADALFRAHPTSRAIDDEQLDSVLAAMAGYYLSRAQQPPLGQVSPHLRTHQRQNGLATLDWLAKRRDW